MIQVGIQDNIRIISAIKNDRGTLIINKMQDGAGGASLLDILSSSSTATTDNDNGFFIWPLQEDERLTTEAEKYADAMNKLKVLRAQLNHYLEQYMPSAHIKWDILRNIGITVEQELVDGLMNPVQRPILLAGLYNNYVDQFIAQITPFVGPTSPLMRVKLIRQSKDKNFATIPKFAPFIEPMTVNKTATTLKWSRYDLGFRKGDPENGPYSGLNLSDGTPVTGAGAAAAAATPADEAKNKALFGV